MSPNESLAMPARRFFAILRETKRVHAREKFHVLHELCDIGVLGAQKDTKFYKHLRKTYRAGFHEPDAVPKTAQDGLRHNKQVASRLYAILGGPKQKGGITGNG